MQPFQRSKERFQEDIDDMRRDMGSRYATCQDVHSYCKQGVYDWASSEVFGEALRVGGVCIVPNGFFDFQLSVHVFQS